MNINQNFPKGRIKTYLLINYFIFNVGDDDVGSDDRWGSPNRGGGEAEDDEDVDYNFGGGLQNPFQPPFQHQFGRGIPSFLPNRGGFGPPSGLGTPFRPPGPLVTSPPIRTSSAPPGSQSEMVRLS